MIEFILANIEAVGSLIVALVLLIYAIFTKQWGAVRTAALSLMLSAEKLLETEQGRIKMDWVFREMQSKIPVWLRPYLTDDRLKTTLQQIYDNAKKMLQ